MEVSCPMGPGGLFSLFMCTEVGQSFWPCQRWFKGGRLRIYHLWFEGSKKSAIFLLFFTFLSHISSISQPIDPKFGLILGESLLLHCTKVPCCDSQEGIKGQPSGASKWSKMVIWHNFDQFLLFLLCFSSYRNYLLWENVAQASSAYITLRFHVVTVMRGWKVSHEGPQKGQNWWFNSILTHFCCFFSVFSPIWTTFCE